MKIKPFDPSVSTVVLLFCFCTVLFAGQSISNASGKSDNQQWHDSVQVAITDRYKDPVYAEAMSNGCYDQAIYRVYFSKNGIDSLLTFCTEDSAKAYVIERASEKGFIFNKIAPVKVPGR